MPNVLPHSELIQMALKASPISDISHLVRKRVS